MKRVLRVKVGMIFLALLLAFAPRAGAYRFEIVAKTGDTFDGQTLTEFGVGGSKISLNNHGQVAFYGKLSGGEGIFLHNNLLIKTGDTIGGKTLTGLDENPSLNNNGQVAFWGTYYGSDFSVISTQNGVVIQPHDVIGGKELFYFRDQPSINDSGLVAFGGFHRTSYNAHYHYWNYECRLYTQNGLVAKPDDIIGGISLPNVCTDRSVNNNGLVAFGAEFSGGGSGIFTQNGLVVKVGDTISGKTLTSIEGVTSRRPSLNNNGLVAFKASFSGGRSGIFTQNGLLVQQGDTIDGYELGGSLSHPSLNDSGQVAFEGGFGIFTQNSRVARIWDMIGGKELLSVNSPAINNSGQVAFLGDFTDGSTAVILASPGPDKASLVSPSGTVSTNTPTYTWNAVSDSTFYYLWVNDGSGTPVKKWYSATAAGCSGGSGTCYVTPDTPVGGAAMWWIQTWDSSGYGPWSDGMTFVAPSLAAAKVTLESPSGNISTSTPSYVWNADSHATWYYLWVKDSGQEPKNKWYPASIVGCAGGAGSCSITPDFVVGGTAKWWVQTWNAYGYGPWSDSLTFQAPSPNPPAKVTLLSPAGNIAKSLPTYKWSAVPNATWYLLWVGDDSGNPINNWYRASEVGCAGGTGSCSVTPDILVGGTAKWWIQAWNSLGYSPWSDGMAFEAPLPTLPSKAMLVFPSGTLSTRTPTYTWNPAANATWYLLWVDDSTGNKIKTWYRASEAGCAGAVGICSVTPEILLATGLGKWWIQTWNRVGNGPWSDGMTFTVSVGSGFND
jgi:hypothetical protein